MSQGKPQRAPNIEAREFLSKNWAVDGVLSFPVEPLDIAQKLGIEVSFVKGLPDDVSGLLLRKEADAPIQAAINVERPVEHQRFTLAHELGHYVLLDRAGQLNQQVGFVERRSELSSLGTDPVEIFSNQFAAELLMPEGAVRFYVRDGLSFDELCNLFVVSGPAMSHRLSNLGITL